MKKFFVVDISIKIRRNIYLFIFRWMWCVWWGWTRHSLCLLPLFACCFSLFVYYVSNFRSSVTTLFKFAFQHGNPNTHIRIQFHTVNMRARHTQNNRNEKKKITEIISVRFKNIPRTIYSKAERESKREKNTHALRLFGKYCGNSPVILWLSICFLVLLFIFGPNNE